MWSLNEVRLTCRVLPIRNRSKVEHLKSSVCACYTWQKAHHLFRVDENSTEQYCVPTLFNVVNNIVQHSIVTPDCGLMQAQIYVHRDYLA